MAVAETGAGGGDDVGSALHLPLGQDHRAYSGHNLYLGLQSKSRQRIPAADAPSAQRWVDSVDITALCTVAGVSVSASRYLVYLCLH